MAVYHFTLHAYRSWRPDHPRGYVKYQTGILPPDPDMADAYDRQAKFSAVEFDAHIQRRLIRGSFDICSRRKWRLHGVGTDRGHFHAVVSWHGFIPCDDVMRKLKNILSYLLGRDPGPPGRRWFVRDGSRRRVRDAAHLNYLLDRYLPDHRGLFWREGRPLP